MSAPYTDVRAQRASRPTTTRTTRSGSLTEGLDPLEWPLIQQDNHHDLSLSNRRTPPSFHLSHLRCYANDHGLARRFFLGISSPPRHSATPPSHHRPPCQRPRTDHGEPAEVGGARTWEGPVRHLEPTTRSTMRKLGASPCAPPICTTCCSPRPNESNMSPHRNPPRERRLV